MCAEHTQPLQSPAQRAASAQGEQHRPAMASRAPR
jgi:hypothetical protein